MITALLLYICTTPLNCQVYAQRIWTAPDQVVLCEQVATRLTGNLTAKNRRTTRFACETQTISSTRLDYPQTHLL